MNITPATLGSSSSWTKTAMGTSPPAESITVATAPWKDSHPTTPRIESNTPAIDEASVSSALDEDRTTRLSCPELLSVSHASSNSGASWWAPDAVAWIGITNPGSTGSPALEDLASAAAFAPPASGSSAMSSERLTAMGGPSSLRTAFFLVWCNGTSTA